ncbi:MAG: 2-C-methyl-D-erythritol 4-phosphate cytidylyltransferase [Kiritimatiellae bacterium]|nr:2-C-methyl-D-erythritol 4-phosphate cytidylyltransferase [Kiritimatiellia bacterium]
MAFARYSAPEPVIVNTTTCAIVLASDRDENLGSAVCPPFLYLHNRPVLAYALSALSASPEIDSFVVAIPKDRAETMLNLVKMFGYSKIRKIVAAPAKRSSALLAALEHVPETADWICLLDPSRPLVNAALVSDTVRAAHRHGAAVAATELLDPVVLAKRGAPLARVASSAREHLWSLLSPLAATKADIRAAAASFASAKKDFPDIAALADALPVVPRPVPDTPAPFSFFRVRSADDLPAAVQLLRAQGTIA